MTPTKERINKTFDLHGESFEIEGRPTKGFFQLLDLQSDNIYLDDIESSAVVRPGLICWITGDTSASVGESVVRDGRTYEIKKLSKLRRRDEVMLQVIVLV